MDNISIMHMSETFQNLEHEVFYMIKWEILFRVYDTM